MTAKVCHASLCFFACALLSSLSAVSADEARKPPNTHGPVSGLHIRWDGIMGEDKNTPDETYCLMGSGFITASTSSSINKLISTWRAKHPQAKEVRVSSYGPVARDRPNSLITYIWVVDGQTTLNEYLVRQGACPGGTMQIPDYDDISTRVNRVEKLPFHFKNLVSPRQYERLMRKMAKAESQAQKEKLGIWKNGTDGVY